MATYENIRVFGRTLNAEKVFKERVLKPRCTWCEDTGYGKWIHSQDNGNYTTIDTPYETLRGDKVYTYSLLIVHRGNQAIRSLCVLGSWEEVFKAHKERPPGYRLCA